MSCWVLVSTMVYCHLKYRKILNVYYDGIFCSCLTNPCVCAKWNWHSNCNFNGTAFFVWRSHFSLVFFSVCVAKVCEIKQMCLCMFGKLASNYLKMRKSTQHRPHRYTCARQRANESVKSKINKKQNVYDDQVFSDEWTYPTCILEIQWNKTQPVSRFPLASEFWILKFCLIVFTSIAFMQSNSHWWNKFHAHSCMCHWHSNSGMFWCCAIALLASVPNCKYHFKTDCRWQKRSQTPFDSFQLYWLHKFQAAQWT